MAKRTIKALSVKQPWANMIASGEKTIETRAWGTNYRGELLIVSSKVPAIEPAGCAVALVNVVDCRPMIPADEPAACCQVYPNAQSWVLNDIRAVEPFPVKGLVGVFAVEIDEQDLRRRKRDRGY